MAPHHSGTESLPVGELSSEFPPDGCLMTLTPGTLRSATAVALGALLALPACAIPHSHAGHNHEGHEHTPDYEMEGLAHELAIAKPAPSAVQFPLSAVKIAPDSLYGIAQQRNLEFQLSLNDSQWLCQMTSAANLTACAGKCATPGGVGAPACEQLPGEMGPGGYCKKNPRSFISLRDLIAGVHFRRALPRPLPLWIGDDVQQHR